MTDTPTLAIHPHPLASAAHESLTDTSVESAVNSIWYTRSPVPTPLGLAAQLGWFVDEFRGDGIGVFTVQDSADPAVLSSHRDHHLTHSFRQGGSLHALWARARGRDTRVIGLHWLDEYQAILGLPGRGIRTPVDLRGGRLALPQDQSVPVNSARAAALRGFSVALQTAGLSQADVEFVDVQSLRALRLDPSAPGSAYGEYGAVVAALVAGDVDAIYVKGAHGMQTAARLKTQPVLAIHNHPDPLQRANHGAPRPITVDTALLQSRPDIVVRFLSCIVDVQAWAATHPHETVSYVAREAQSTDDWVREAYGADLHLRQATDFAPASVAALAVYQRFLLEQGLIEADFDLEAWLDRGPLDEVLRQHSRGGKRHV